MRTRTKAEAIKIIHDCAVLYDRNLSYKNILFVTTRKNSVACFETFFIPRYFMHLTGIASHLERVLFFRNALHGRLNSNDISLAPNGTTDMKLDVLPQLMNIHVSARMVGEYDYSRPLLITDKFAGTVTMAMGFIQLKNGYVPNTVLKKDVRDITERATQYRVAATFVKQHREQLYTNFAYIAKGLTIDDALFGPALSDKVDFPNLVAAFEIPKNPLAERLSEAADKAAYQNTPNGRKL